LIAAADPEAGYTVIELIIVMAILTIVLGAIVALFTSGINADADQNRRFQAQQDVRVAMDKLRRELHSGCTVSDPATYNTPVNSVTIYVPADSCAAGSNSITWCTTGSAGNFTLYRIVATSCAGATQYFAEHLTNGTPFVYLPPNSHLVSSSSLGQGTSVGYIVTADGSSTLPRLHVDLTSNLSSKSTDAYRLVDDIGLRNGPRACGAGVASC
jgi:prepilin-type N-terminal cleavage/methylation domain-containing protein